MISIDPFAPTMFWTFFRPSRNFDRTILNFMTTPVGCSGIPVPVFRVLTVSTNVKKNDESLPYFYYVSKVRILVLIELSIMLITC